MVQEHSHDAGSTEIMTSNPAIPSMSHEEKPRSPLLQKTSVLKKKLKRKLENGWALDQYDCKFGVRLDESGDVVIMSDESEISSLNDEEVAQLRDRYERVRKQEVTEEVQLQRGMQIQELEAALRVEEAKLLMLKKLRQSQQQNASQKMQNENVNRLAPGVVQNSSGQAYKPKVAIANQQSTTAHFSQNYNQLHHQNAGTTATKINGSGTAHGGKKLKASKTANAESTAASQFNIGAIGAASGIQLSTLPPQHLNVIQQLYERLSQNPQQMANLIKTLPQPTGQALTELLRQYAMAQAGAAAATTTAGVVGGAGAVNTGSSQQPQQQQHPQNVGSISTKSAVSHHHHHQQQQQSTTGAGSGVVNPALSQAQIDAAHKQAREMTQQNVSKARQQLRRELEQMISKLPVPKAPASDLQFIPNGNQPDFAYLLGLDLTVQRVVKDRQMFRKSDLLPYQCEECETDFTPSWKAICGENEDYHLYCENCVRQAQKRKVCQEYKKMWNSVLQTVKDRENEFERQVSSGKFNVEPVLPNPPAGPPAMTNVQQTEKMTKVLQQQNNVSSSVGMNQLTKSSSSGSAITNLSQHSQHQQQQQNAPPMGALNLSKSTGSISAATGLSNTAIKNANSITTTPQQKTTMASKRAMANSSVAAASNITPTNASASSNPLAALQNPVLQQQFATMAALSNSPLLRQMASNPLMLAAMAQNPMVMQQLFTTLATQQHQRVAQQQQTAVTPTTAANTSATSNIAAAGAAAALAQLAQRSNQQAQQQQQHHAQHSHNRSSTQHSSAAHHSTPTSTNTAASGTATSASSGSSAINQQQAMASMAAALMNSAANPFLAIQSINASNPQLLTQLSANPQFRQFLQMHMQMKAAGSASGGACKK